MGSIYRRAEMVIVWLGISDAESDHAALVLGKKILIDHGYVGFTRFARTAYLDLDSEATENVNNSLKAIRTLF